MKNKLILLSMVILTLLIAVSAVSAAENVTDAVSQDEASVDDVAVPDDASVDEVAIQDEAAADEVTTDDSASDMLTDDIKENTPIADSKNSKDNPEPVPKPVKKVSKIKASKAVGYQRFTSKVAFKLTADGKPLVGKKITIKLNGRTFYKKTDKSGKAYLKYNIAKKGKHTVKFSYAGDNTTSVFRGSSKIVIKKSYRTRLVVADKCLNFRQGSKCLFYAKVLNENGKPIKGKVVEYKIKGKKYKAKSDRFGNAKIYLKLKKGNYKVGFTLHHKAPYIGSHGTYKFHVRAPMAKGNGYWLWPMHMKTVNLKSLAKRGTKHILLHGEAVSAYGKSYVKSFIKKAHRYGLKVHLWIQICYDENDGWVSPVNKDLTLKYGFMNSKIREAVRFAKIGGVDGIHMDYVRFGGTAHKYKASAEKAINYIVKWASYKIHKAKPNCIVSAAVMPEPNMMHYYYGQDIPTMSKYLDVIIPMVYKGNYHSGRGWIKSVVHTFAKQSYGAQIWAGLQSYRSDSDLSLLSQSELLKDAKAAKAGGAKGSIIFRVGLSHNFYFKKV